MRSTPRPRANTAAPQRWGFIGTGGCLAVTAVLLLTGCVPTAEEPLRKPASTNAAPLSRVFQSDEDALESAIDAYGDYLAATDEILRDGGREGERISSYVSVDYYEVALNGFAAFSSDDTHLAGYTRFDNPALQTYVDENGIAEIVMYVCLDVAATQIMSAGNADVTPPGRRTRAPLEVSFMYQPSESPRPLVTDSTLWDGEDFCSNA